MSISRRTVLLAALAVAGVAAAYAASPSADDPLDPVRVAGKITDPRKFLS